MHALSGIRAHGLSVQAIKAYASDCAVTGPTELQTSQQCCRSPAGIGCACSTTTSLFINCC
jgi:hypothetical protein